MRSMARPAFIRRAGRAPTAISAAPWRSIEAKLHDARRDRAGAPQGAFRLGALRRLAGRPPGGIRGPRRRHAGLAAARRQRFWLRSDVPAGRPRRRPIAHLRRDGKRGKTRPAAARQRPFASRPRLPQTRGGVSWLNRVAEPGVADDEQAFGVYIHWPFCLSKCPYCDFNSHVRREPIDEPRFARAFATEIGDHSRPRCPAAPCRRFFSAAARLP